jgi:hypothetical protein
MVAQKRLLLAGALLFGAYPLLRAQESGSTTKQNAQISVDALHPERVIGHLGQPLGSVIRVTGMSVDGDETRPKTDSGQTLLKIETVNGKQLTQSVYFTFRRAAEGIKKPESGTPFDYFVHEWGSFDGFVQPPKSLGIETPIVANDGFHFRPEITIHKSNTVPRDPNRQRE